MLQCYAVCTTYYHSTIQFFFFFFFFFLTIQLCRAWATKNTNNIHKNTSSNIQHSFVPKRCTDLASMVPTCAQPCKEAASCPLGEGSLPPLAASLLVRVLHVENAVRARVLSVQSKVTHRLGPVCFCHG